MPILHNSLVCFQQTFNTATQLMLGTEEAAQIVHRIRDVHIRVPEYHDTLPQHVGDASIQSAGTEPCLTNIEKEHLHMQIIVVKFMQRSS